MTRPFEITAMHGLGDNIYFRPFVRAMASHRKTFLATPWPELFEDIDNLEFLFHMSKLRTQAKNLARQPYKHRNWAGRPTLADRIVPRYGDLELRNGGIVKALERFMPLTIPFKMDLPASMRSPYKTGTAVIRPVTTRKEWMNTARNPLPEYIAQIAERLMANFDVILVADLKEGEEWLEGPLPPHHRAYLKGELPVEQLLRLVSAANVVVGGVGWIVPAAIAAGTPAFIINGGQAIHNSKKCVTDPRMDLSKIYFAEPDNFCQCNQMGHQCVKTISDLEGHWNRFTSSLVKS